MHPKFSTRQKYQLNLQNHSRTMHMTPIHNDKHKYIKKKCWSYTYRNRSPRKGNFPVTIFKSSTCNNKNKASKIKTQLYIIFFEKCKYKYKKICWTWEKRPYQGLTRKGSIIKMCNCMYMNVKNPNFEKFRANGLMGHPRL